jgi:tricarballylate dehydrogenase
MARRTSQEPAIASAVLGCILGYPRTYQWPVAMEQHSCDVVVAGGGNAATCTALSARWTVAEVLVLERAPFGELGGKTAPTAHALRFGYSADAEILALVPDLSEHIHETDFGSHSEDSFYAALARISECRTDPGPADILASRSFPKMKWPHANDSAFCRVTVVNRICSADEPRR